MSVAATKTPRRVGRAIHECARHVRLGCGHRRLPDRGRDDGRRPRRVDLGPVRLDRGQRRPRRHRRSGLRALLPLAGRPRPDALARARGLPLLDRLATDPADGPRAGQPARPRLLPRARRGNARARHRAAGDALPLGPAAGAPGRGRLGLARRRRALRRVRRDRLRRPRRHRARLDHAQRAVGDVHSSATPTGSRRPGSATGRPRSAQSHHSLLAHGAAVGPTARPATTGRSGSRST